jgi:inner membrane protein
LTAECFDINFFGHGRFTSRVGDYAEDVSTLLLILKNRLINPGRLGAVKIRCYSRNRPNNVPSPVGHCLLGLTLSKSSINKTWRLSLAGIGLILFSANAADLDFLPGLLIGDINRFHHGISHSFGMALIYAFIGTLCVSHLNLFANRRILFLQLLMVYISHLVADMLTADGSEPFGIPLLWPLNESYIISPVTLFQKIEHGPYGGATASVLENIFSWHNLMAIGVESLLITPVLLWVLWHKRKT